MMIVMIMMMIVMMMMMMMMIIMMMMVILTLFIDYNNDHADDILFKAFEEKYEDLMRKGLAYGSGMRPDQYLAMKDRDTAYRIYKLARQRLHRQEKGIIYALSLSSPLLSSVSSWSC